ncbi:MAG TPA: DUF126 domain-containing protein [Methanocorpusculum sp.]|nr:DUF126 domain-containing protein [Methanocorpusculum sp.]
MNLTGRSIAKGTASAPIISTNTPISFLGMVDPKTGVIIDKSHPLHGQSIAGKVLVFPAGKGSTVGSYVIYALKRNGVAPAAFIVRECETIVAVGAIIASIPAVDRINGSFPEDGTLVTVDGTEGTVTY